MDKNTTLFWIFFQRIWMHVIVFLKAWNLRICHGDSSAVITSTLDLYTPTAMQINCTKLGIIQNPCVTKNILLICECICTGRVWCAKSPDILFSHLILQLESGHWRTGNNVALLDRKQCPFTSLFLIWAFKRIPGLSQQMGVGKVVIELAQQPMMGNVVFW